MVQEDRMRKGPWTEQEDMQLACFVGLFGDRRWDFIAKVSGLKVAGESNRTGKSCRLRWVNYLHPGLKRGKLTPHEERLILELHSKWGNRWSRIARKLPGRTDNEIKNYWRTYMRKKAQEKKQARSAPSSSSSPSDIHTTDSLPYTDGGDESFYDTGGRQLSELSENKVNKVVLNVNGYSMDDIWKDIELSSGNIMKSAYESYGEESSYFSCRPMTSSTLEYCPESLWKNDENSKMFPPISDQLLSFYENDHVSLIG